MAALKFLMLVALSTACLAEPPASKDSSGESKDKRGAVSYETDAYSAGHGAAIALPAAASLGYAGLGHSPLLLQGAGIGYLGGHGLSLGAPVALGGHGLALGGHGIALGSHGLGYGGHGLALSSAPLLLGGHGLALGGHGLGLGGYNLAGYGLGVPALHTSSIKLSPSYTSSSADYHTDTYLSPPSKSYGAPSSSSYSSGFQPSSSYSGSSAYSSPSSSYGAPSSSYGAPSSSYSAPSSSYSAPSSSYGPPSSSYGPPSSSYGLPSSSADYSTLSYSSGSSHSARDYRSHHSH